VRYPVAREYGRQYIGTFQTENSQCRNRGAFIIEAHGDA